jgi:hypothetical protein
VVGVQVAEEHGLQPGEVEPCVGEAGWRAAATIDHEDADEIPARPGTGSGAPAVPSSTSSVAMRTILPLGQDAARRARLVVRLTVTHDGFAPGSAVLPAVSEGWPAVLASLKTLLETGSSLRTS